VLSPKNREKEKQIGTEHPRPQINNVYVAIVYYGRGDTKIGKERGVALYNC